MKCRHCGKELKYEFIDLFNSPPSNSYLTEEELNKVEVLYPLKIWVCDNCFLVQIDEYKKSDEIFNVDYAYFSSVSSSWLSHCQKYVDMITERLNLDKKSHVVEIASNDGYLLQYFKEKAIPSLGIEPTASTAIVAKEKGINVIEEFFNSKLAKSLVKSDLILGNNVLAHIPDINDFVKGLKIALKENGTITMEFPHLLNLIKYNQFDTIYHEHFSYLSLLTVKRIFTSQGLKIYDVEELSTHGGSLRIYATHVENDIKIETAVDELITKEKSFNLNKIEGYKNFEKKCQKIKWDFLDFIVNAKKKNKTVVAYGAAAKGNTFLNYCGIKSDVIDFVVDRSPFKQNKYLPMSHIPIVDEEEIMKNKPDYILILPWNIKDEIINQLDYLKNRRGWTKFVLAIPKLKVIR
ncbi:MAG: class I SAM-dependent methyltransferase [Methanobrevibacter sp.]|jgi:SAM-dependent methyltransferase|nr:class I SAM-dependent methyltransferase [Candidatus Methanovirga basalitermitum]